MSFLDLAKKRYSCRKLSAQPVEEEKLQKILEAGNLAPTAVNKQPFHIWVLKSEEAMQKVSQTTSFIFGAPVAFVVGSKAESAFVRSFDKKNFADVDASIAATHMMLEIEALGLGTTWVGISMRRSSRSFSLRWRTMSLWRSSPSAILPKMQSLRRVMRSEQVLR